MFTLINKRDMYSKPLETEEEPARHDWIDNFKGYPQPDTLRILLYENTFQTHCNRIKYIVFINNFLRFNEYLQLVTITSVHRSMDAARFFS